VWSYDDLNHIQTLARLICICGDCHTVKHWGRTVQKGYVKTAVIGWSDAQVKAHADAALREWKERSRHQWTQDLSGWSL
jgi:hypothetical protein